jgi:CRISPR-associated protein Cas1
LLRKAQFHKETDTRFALTQSKEIVGAKIANAGQVLVRASWKDRDTPAPIHSAIDRLKTLEARVDEVGRAESLMGVEGAAAATYWKAFGRLFTARDVSFPGRVKHPPTDPVNAVLSFGYVLLTNFLQSLLDGMGFDPFLGFFHEEHYGRPSLALDLVEPFRSPVVDRFAVRVFNLGILKPRHFKEEPEKGLRMRSQAMRTFFKHWERHLDKMGVHEEMRSQARGLAKVFRGEADRVKPWRWSARG